MTRISRAALVATAILCWLTAGQAGAQAPSIDFDAATIQQLAAAMDAGTLTSERLVQLGLARIEAYDEQGPKLNAVITLNPKALETARALDAERKSQGQALAAARHPDRAQGQLRHRRPADHRRIRSCSTARFRPTTRSSSRSCATPAR